MRQVFSTAGVVKQPLLVGKLPLILLLGKKWLNKSHSVISMACDRVAPYFILHISALWTAHIDALLEILHRSQGHILWPHSGSLSLFSLVGGAAPWVVFLLPHSLKTTCFLTLLRYHLFPGLQASKAIPLEAEDSLGSLGFIQPTLLSLASC